MKFSGVKNEEAKALPEKNDYRLNECKSYAIVFSSEVGHSTLASSSVTSDWHEYMLYKQTRVGEFVTLPGNLTGF